MSAPPRVSIIVPCRNEEAFVGRALESLWGNDYPKDRLEFLVVDGMSSDRTREIVMEFAAAHPGPRILYNPKKSVPAAMNVGIAHARGEVIVKADAHAIYPRDYIARCVASLYEYDADNSGGVLVHRPPDDTLVSHAITLVLSHPLGSGDAPHLRRGVGKPRVVDSTAFGCYRSDVFRRIGLFNEDLLRSSDMDLNQRIRKAGGRVIVMPDVAIDYFPRRGFGEFLKRNFHVGYWVIYSFHLGGRPARARHLTPLAAALIFGLLLATAVLYPVLLYAPGVTIAVYAATVFAVSSILTLQRRDARLLPVLLVVFAARHFLYAAGSLCAAIRTTGSRRFWQDIVLRQPVTAATGGRARGQAG